MNYSGLSLEQRVSDIFTLVSFIKDQISHQSNFTEKQDQALEAIAESTLSVSESLKLLLQSEGMHEISGAIAKHEMELNQSITKLEQMIMQLVSKNEVGDTVNSVRELINQYQQTTKQSTEKVELSIRELSNRNKADMVLIRESMNQVQDSFEKLQQEYDSEMRISERLSDIKEHLNTLHSESKSNYDSYEFKLEHVAKSVKALMLGIESLNESTIKTNQDLRETMSRIELVDTKLSSMDLIGK